MGKRKTLVLLICDSEFKLVPIKAITLSHSSQHREDHLKPYLSTHQSGSDGWYSTVLPLKNKTVLGSSLSSGRN